MSELSMILDQDRANAVIQINMILYYCSKVLYYRLQVGTVGLDYRILDCNSTVAHGRVNSLLLVVQHMDLTTFIHVRRGKRLAGDKAIAFLIGRSEGWIPYI